MTRQRCIALAAVVAVCVLFAAPSRADYADVVKTIEARAGGHRTPVPLFGLVRLGVWIIHPGGVHDVELATWEGVRVVPEAREISQVIRARSGAGYQPVVTSRSRDGEWTFIYARPSRGDLMEVVIVAHDKEDTVAMRAVLDPKTFAEAVNDHKHATDVALK